MSNTKRPRPVSIKAEIFGTTVAAIQHFENKGGYLEPDRFEPSPRLTLRLPTLAKLLETRPGLRVRHTSEFSGMTDGMETVPAERQAMAPEELARHLRESDTSLRASWDPSDQSVRVYGSCDSFEIVDGDERDRRAAALEADPLPSLLDTGNVDVRQAERARVRYLAGLTPMAWDEACIALRDERDPVRVLALVAPEWHAVLVKSAPALEAA